MTYDFSYPQALDAQERGWGRGWQTGDPIGVRPSGLQGVVVPLVVRGVPFVGGIREELHDLATLLLEESLRREYIPNLMDPGCWGGAFRPTKRSDGSYTTTPSNHSWYTALDINAPRNVFGASTHEIPAEMAALWREYGWRWLGPPIGDWMHFDYAGSPQDAANDTARARADFTIKEEQVAFQDYIDGETRYRERFKVLGQDPGEPPVTKSSDWKAGWNSARFAARHPQPEPQAHSHPEYAKEDHGHASGAHEHNATITLA